MPKKPIDYSKTIIYKIVCNDLNVHDIYIGSTTDFTRRKRQHKHSCFCPTNNRHNLKIYQIIRKNGDWDNWSMIMIEQFSCNNKLECLARERFWCEKLNASLNTQIPNRSKNELQICECGGKFRFDNKIRHLTSKKHQKYLISNNINGNKSTACQEI